MPDKKPWFQSTTILAGVFGLLFSAAGLFGFTVDEALKIEILNFLASAPGVIAPLVTFIISGATILGRIRATKQIGKADSTKSQSGRSDLSACVLVAGAFLVMALPYLTLTGCATGGGLSEDGKEIVSEYGTKAAGGALATALIQTSSDKRGAALDVLSYCSAAYTLLDGTEVTQDELTIAFASFKSSKNSAQYEVLARQFAPKLAALLNKYPQTKFATWVVEGAQFAATLQLSFQSADTKSTAFPVLAFTDSTASALADGLRALNCLIATQSAVLVGGLN